MFWYFIQPDTSLKNCEKLGIKNIQPTQYHNSHTKFTLLKLFSADCYITVGEQAQPPPNVMSDGFSISAWIYYTGDTDGYILAKTSTDAARQYYALKISIADTSQSAVVSFRYSIMENQVLKRISLSFM